MQRDQDHGFGVFKPVGHVVVSFPQARQSRDAMHELEGIGLTGDGDAAAVRVLSDQEMLAQTDRDLAGASPWAALGQELNLVRAQRVLAERGYHFVVVHAPGDRQAAEVAAIVGRHGAERAQAYGRFIIEELIERPGALPQVGESPDRGLDAQTPSGREGEGREPSPPRGAAD